MGCCSAKSETVAEEAHVDLSGKVAIVTGANTGGIGQHTALILSRYKCKVVMTGRSRERIESAAQEIRQHVPHADLVCMACDLSSFASVRAFVQQFLALNIPLNYLINNGAVMACPYSKSVDGVELQMATNHLGHFLLTYLLLDKLKASAPSRIVCVSSIAHSQANLNTTNVNEALNTPAEKYSPWVAYGNSKLCNILHARALNKRLQGTQVTAYTLHPGSISSALGRNNCGAACYYTVFGMCQKNITQGTATSVYVTMQPGIENLAGAYFKDCHVAEASKVAGDGLLADLVWERSLEMCGLKGAEEAKHA